jgi:hypothetical protein
MKALLTVKHAATSQDVETAVEGAYGPIASIYSKRKRSNPIPRQFAT